MTTSGSVNYTQNRNEIILDALQLIGVYGIGRTVSGEDMAFCNSMLNKMVKAWQGKGIHLWTMEEGVLFVTKNTGEYTLSSTGAYAANWDDSVLTQLNGAHTASDTTLVVDLTTGMAASDTIGIVLTDGTIHWTTIVSVDSSTTLTITSGLASAASDNANIYTFTSKINRPLKIHSMRRVEGIASTSTSGVVNENEMRILSQQEFMAIPTKDSNGQPICAYYNPDLSSTKLYMWPRPSSVNYYFRFSYTRMLEDFDASTDNADFPSEWLEVLTYQLATRIGPAFGRMDNVINAVAPMAVSMLEDMLNYDSETTSLQFGPDLE